VQQVIANLGHFSGQVSKRLNFLEDGEMKSGTLIGLALVVLGILALVYQGIGYTKQKDIVDVGPIHATADQHKTIPLPPVVGAIALIGGIVLIARDRR
jgi:hypothetical protein